jgi:hypothetical protein
MTDHMFSKSAIERAIEINCDSWEKWHECQEKSGFSFLAFFSKYAISSLPNVIEEIENQITSGGWIEGSFNVYAMAYADSFKLFVDYPTDLQEEKARKELADMGFDL